MDLYVGASGFSYKEWKGSFYPEDLPAKQMLHFYGERLRTVEINNTFHRMPKVSVLEGWAAEVPAEFKFALKAPQRITHMQRLKDSADSVAYFLETTATLQERLGPVLFQLPPYLKNDLPRLKDFLDLLPPQRRVAFEFRHASWFNEEIFDLLRAHGVALCVAEMESGFETPFMATANWGYLRLRKPNYDDAELKNWVGQVLLQDWREAYVFFKHEDQGKAPQMARRFLELAGSRK